MRCHGVELQKILYTINSVCETESRANTGYTGLVIATSLTIAFATFKL